MTAVLSPQPPQAVSSASSTQQSPQPQPQSQSQAQAQPPTEATTSKSTTSPSLAAQSPTPSSQHLSAPTDSTTTDTSSSSSSAKPRSRSRGPQNTGTPSRSRTSILSTSTRTSSIFPSFPSSLSYALVRDFAYPAFHPLHYGPTASSHRNSQHSDASQDDSFSYPYGDRSMGSDRRLSDPPPNWEASKGMWAAGPWGGDGGAVYGSGSGDQLPSTSFGYDSDEGAEPGERETSGLLTKNHRKSKSLAVGEETTPRRRKTDKKEKKTEKRKDNSHLGTGLDSQGFFQAGATDEEEEDPQKNAYGWEVTASPTDEHRPNMHHSQSQYSHDSASHHQFDASQNSGHASNNDEQDESFAGPSLALYTFQPENANELALKEGQIIQVGYRHGQGWLVAMDLETGEQGLVPEEYVRLLRDIEGWGEEDMDLGDEDESGEGTEDVGGDDDGVEGSGEREVKMGDVEMALGEPGGGQKQQVELTESPVSMPDRTKEK